MSASGSFQEQCEALRARNNQKLLQLGLGINPAPAQPRAPAKPRQRRTWTPDPQFERMTRGKESADSTPGKGASEAQPESEKSNAVTGTILGEAHTTRTGDLAMRVHTRVLISAVVWCRGGNAQHG